MRFFFFSSRRRHTRLQGDWSSDVCSSDLEASLKKTVGDLIKEASAKLGEHIQVRRFVRFQMGERSEERRVGKESRARGSTAKSRSNRQRNAVSASMGRNGWGKRAAVMAHN